MKVQYVLRCVVCHNVIGKPYISLDRRTQMHATAVIDDTLREIIKVIQAHELFRYDDQGCRNVHEPKIVAELKLKSTYPGTGTTAPCSRCSAMVDRRLPHVSYSFMEAEMESWVVTKVIDDTELAVLCRECEEPDEPVTQAAAAVIDQPERSRA